MFGLALNILLKLFSLLISSSLKNLSSCQAFFSSSSLCSRRVCSFWIIRRSSSLLGRSSNSCLSSRYSSSIIWILFLFSSIMTSNYFLISCVHSICSLAIPWIFFSCWRLSSSSLKLYYFLILLISSLWLSIRSSIFFFNSWTKSYFFSRACFVYWWNLRSLIKSYPIFLNCALRSSRLDLVLSWAFFSD